MDEKVECKYCGSMFKKNGIHPHEKHCREKSLISQNGLKNDAETAKQSMTKQFIRADRPIEYVNCPHCEGVMVLGENEVEHVNDLRSFLVKLVTESLVAR